MASTPCVSSRFRRTQVKYGLKFPPFTRHNAGRLELKISTRSERIYETCASSPCAAARRFWISLTTPKRPKIKGNKIWTGYLVKSVGEKPQSLLAKETLIQQM